VGVVTSNVLFYRSPTLEDTQHTLEIKNLQEGGELQLDYFEVTGSTLQGGMAVLASSPTNSPDTGRNSLQPAVIAGLVLSSVVVLAGFILLFILWRRQYVRERGEKSGMRPKPQPKPRDDTQRDPFTSVSSQSPSSQPPSSQSPSSQPPPSQPPSSQPSSSQPSSSPIPVPMTITPLRPRPSGEQVVPTSTSRRDEKRLLPTGPGYAMESISRLNLGLDVNPGDHSVVGQPSDYESEASAVPRYHRDREYDGGVSLLGSSETINPKALRLPPDYRQFCP